jgi:hypothetical protein
MRHRHRFSPNEDNQLRMVVDQIGTSRWDIVASFLPFRTARQCRDRYRNYLLDFLVAVPWTPAEDELVRRKHAENGPKWAEISKSLTGRSGNDVKNRWHRHLAKKSDDAAALLPNTTHTPDTPDGFPHDSPKRFPSDILREMGFPHH